MGKLSPTRFGFILLVMMLAAPLAAYAADPVSDYVGATVSVDEVFKLEIHPDTDYQWISGPDLPTPDNFNDIVSGVYDPNGNPINLDAQGYGWTTAIARDLWIWSNAGWKISIKGVDSFFDVTTGGWELKPVTDILWQDGVPGGWHQLSLVNAKVKSYGSAPPPDGYHEVTVSLRVLLHWGHDLSGTYTYAPIIITLGPD